VLEDDVELLFVPMAETDFFAAGGDAALKEELDDDDDDDDAVNDDAVNDDDDDGDIDASESADLFEASAFCTAGALNGEGI
jgi:hypothetical protein